MGWKFEPSRIRSAREVNDMTQAVLAEKAGITVQQLSVWENGEVSPGQDSLMKLCNAMSCPPKYFFVSSGDDNHHNTVEEKKAA
jgi:transcriptional regulator with XRE-family HTH domain